MENHRKKREIGRERDSLVAAVQRPLYIIAQFLLARGTAKIYSKEQTIFSPIGPPVVMKFGSVSGDAIQPHGIPKSNG